MSSFSDVRRRKDIAETGFISVSSHLGANLASPVLVGHDLFEPDLANEVLGEDVDIYGEDSKNHSPETPKHHLMNN